MNEAMHAQMGDSRLSHAAMHRDADALRAMASRLRNGETRVSQQGSFPHVLSFEFLASDPPRFPAIVAHARVAFGPAFHDFRWCGLDFHRLLIHSGTRRFDPPGRRLAQLDAAGLERDRDSTLWLLRRLVPTPSWRLWLNGWEFHNDGEDLTAQVLYLTSAWFEWAARHLAPVHARQASEARLHVDI